MEETWTPVAHRRDEAHLRQFVDRHLPMVWGIALYHLGERQPAAALTEEVLVEAVRDLEQVADPRTLRRWLQTRTLAAVRRAIPEARTEGAGGGMPDGSAEEPAPGARAVLDAVATLPPEVRRPAILRSFLGQTFASIGARTGLDRDGVEAAIRRAKDLVTPGRAS